MLDLKKIRLYLRGGFLIISHLTSTVFERKSLQEQLYNSVQSKLMGLTLGSVLVPYVL